MFYDIVINDIMQDNHILVMCENGPSPQLSIQHLADFSFPRVKLKCRLTEGQCNFFVHEVVIHMFSLHVYYSST